MDNGGVVNIPRWFRSAESAEEADDPELAEEVVEGPAGEPSTGGDIDPEHPLPPPVPAGRWSPDVLGEGFEARTLELLPDEEGEVVATAVRYRPERDPDGSPAPEPRFPVLYVHGWNDYFHQRELARQWSRIGGAFYALDLRKYGRSLREHQSRGYVESLSVYDEDIRAVLGVIREDHPSLGAPVIMAHSTGGLITALWAHRHPGALRGLVLNAPWLELQGSSIVRVISQPVVEQLARIQPKRIMPLGDAGHYGRTLQGLEPEELAALGEDEAADPYNAGWHVDPAWRRFDGAPVRAGWLAAILAGHAQVADGLEVGVPILVLSSTRSILATKWTPELRTADMVVDVDLMARRALNLGPVVTVVRLTDAIHDVMLSSATVRGLAYRELSRWTRAYVDPDG